MATVIGLVLAGGQSSRLGQDKTQIEYYGQTLVERMARLLRECCGTAYVSCRDPRIVSPEFSVIVDETERIGPVGGIATALRQLGQPVCAVACDLPFMERSMIGRLLEARRTRPPGCVMTTWEQAETGFIESLVAVYEPEALPYFEHGIATGCFKLSRIIPPHARHAIPYGPEQSRLFFNINYPHDLAQLHAAPSRPHQKS